METHLTLDLVNPQSGQVEQRALVLSGDPPHHVFSCRTLSGSTALQLVLRSAGEPVLIAEIQAPGGEQLRLRFSPQSNGNLRVESAGRPVAYFSPSVPIASPFPGWFLPVDSRKFDIHFLIDATTLHPHSDPQKTGAASLFGLDAWTVLTQQLAAIPGELAKDERNDIRTAVTAFGDFEGCLLYPGDPEARTLRTCNRAELLNALTGIPPVSGGDYVDALAEGLESCIQAGWREDARKLLVVFGDSPGYSVLDAQSPALQLADAGFRRLDVYEQAEELHSRGVEIVTIFHEAAARSLEIAHDHAGILVRHARKQYQRLASMAAWAITSDSPDAAGFARLWSQHREVLGRGACPGVDVGMTAGR